MSALVTRLHHLWLGVHLLPGLLANVQQRRLLAEMRAVGRQLPDILKQPIPQAMTRLENMRPPRPFPLPSENNTRQLADLAALLDRHSSLGLCLRRSLLRYRYLHELNVPVTVLFGAKFAPGKPSSVKTIMGHAWLVLDGRPYYEDDENWLGYTVILRWPKREADA